jgi:hypothetical protein
MGSQVSRALKILNASLHCNGKKLKIRPVEARQNYFCSGREQGKGRPSKGLRDSAHRAWGSLAPLA